MNIFVGRYKKLPLVKQLVTKKSVSFILFFILSSVCYANPEGGVVTAGNATIDQTSNHTEIQQQSPKAIIDWHSFNVGTNESVHFQQPTNGIVLNRIDSAQGVSQILGQLSATGKVVLVNQAGIYFGPSARVDVGSLIASATNITNENFLAGKLTFDQISSVSQGAIINEGIITAAKHGLIALVGPGVINDGIIRAHLGNVVLASGNKYTIDLYGDQLINFVIDEATTATGVHNKEHGRIEADGGTILVAAKNASNVVENVICMEGVAQANSVAMHKGEIILLNDAVGEVKATVKVRGTLDASGQEQESYGGKIKITGKDIDIDNSNLDASGAKNGGDIDIGNDYYTARTGTANTVFIGSSAKLSADGYVNGSGGNVNIQAHQKIQGYGKISAHGGAETGNGGYLRTVAPVLDVKTLQVNLRSPHGFSGYWMLN